MAVFDILLGAISFIWTLFKSWLTLFSIPFSNFHIIWIIIPIWLSWFFAEFFQEKKGTSLGNAISNGVIPFWVGIDWTRFLTTSIIDKELGMTPLTFVKYVICALVLVYGFLVIFFGIRGKQFAKRFGRVREISYVLLMFSPIVYGLVELEWRFILSLFLFFPVFYFAIELIDRVTPDPKIIKMDSQGLKEEDVFSSGKSGKESDDLFKDTPGSSDPFGSLGGTGTGSANDPFGAPAPGPTGSSGTGMPFKQNPIPPRQGTQFGQRSMQRRNPYGRQF